MVQSTQMVRGSRALRVVLAYLLLSVLPALPQQQPETPVTALRILALEGNGAVNYIPTRTATAPVVEVRDQNDHPVEGAMVEFVLPSTGPGASFDGDQATQRTVTDFRGQAGTKGYVVNSTPGRFSIQVTATYRNVTGQLLITQTNSMQLPASATGIQPSRRKKWIWIGIAAAAGAGAGTYFGMRNTSQPISVSTGPVVVGGPR